MPVFLLQSKTFNATTTVVLILFIFFFVVGSASAATATYNFVGVDNANAGTSGNPIAIEHDSDVFPWTTSTDQNDSAAPSDAEYVNISADNTAEWATDDPRRNDEMAITFRFFLNELVSAVTNVQVKWNGNTDGNTASNLSIWLRKDGLDEFGGTSTWVQLGSSLSITQDTDTDLIRSLTTDFSTYINASTGQFEFVVTTDNDSEDMRTNYVEVEVTYTDTTAPGAVSDLATSSATGSSIDLTWTAPGDDGNTGTASTYDVHYSTSLIDASNFASATTATGEPTPSVAGSSESMTITGLSANTTYYFAIKTSDEIPNTSTISNVVSTTTATTPDTTAPDAVTDLATSGATPNAIDLSWTAPGDDGSTGTATSYDVRYSTTTIDESNFAVATAATGEPTPSIAGSSESMTVSGLSADTTYYFAIKTSDEAPNVSAISNVPNLSTTVTLDTTAPADTTDLAASGATSSSIDLSWTAPGDDGNTDTATTYDVRYSTSLIDASNFSSAIEATSEPSPSTAGSYESMTVSGLSAGTTYFFALKTSDEVPNTSNISNVVSLTTSEISGVIIPETGGGVAPTSAHFSGRAYPGSKVEILRKDTINPGFRNIPVERFYISPGGEFNMTILALLQGEYFFALRAKDKEGRKTGIKSFSVNFISENRLTAKDLFLPPTLGFKKPVVIKGSDVQIVGYSAPDSTIDVQIDGKLVGDTKSNNLGQYTFLSDTTTLKNGTHSVRVRQIDKEGISSDFSLTRIFKVTELESPRADFNNDNAINITDWSIFLFRWGSDDSTLRSKVDMNDNGKIDISDFSIFLRAMQT